MMTKAQTRTVGGARVTINETASEALVAAAAQEATVTDGTGRTIRLKKPGVLAQFRLVEALGESARNEVYLATVTPLIFVTAMTMRPLPCRPPRRKSRR